MRRAALALVALAGCGVLRSPAPAPQLAHPTAPAFDADTDAISVTWIGHATVLVGIRGHWFLTDPVLGDRIGALYPRTVRAGIDPADLPPLDAILVSHSHLDHLDAPTLRRFAGTPVLVPDGTARYLPRGTAAVPLRTWQAWHDGAVTITAVPSSHASARYAVDQWVRHGHTGFVIQVDDLCVYFAGYTGFDARQARAIHDRFAIDVALIPVGPTRRGRVVEWLRKSVHVTPRAAMHLFAALGAQWMVPIHYGTFYGDLRHDLPEVERAVDGDRHVRILGIGETAEFLY